MKLTQNDMVQILAKKAVLDTVIMAKSKIKEKGINIDELTELQNKDSILDIYNELYKWLIKQELEDLSKNII
jgi:hypothetical protein